MHIEVDNNGYVCCILYGCHTDNCIEYTGKVPAEPEEYADIDDWAERAQTRAYYLDGEGNLAYNASKATTEDAAIPDMTGSYSKEETLTPARWIDGNPIYKRTFICEVTKLSTYIDAGVIDNLLDVVDIKGTFLGTESGTWTSVNAYSTDSYNRYVRINDDGTVQCISKGTLGTMYVTVFYTKFVFDLSTTAMLGMAKLGKMILGKSF